MKLAGIALLVLVGLGVAAVLALRMADGPVGPLPGGRLTTGELVSGVEIDWSEATGGEIERQLKAPLLIEVQFVDPPRSRITGVMLYGGELYVPCDLGFSWGRFSGPQRWILHFIYLVKDWHTNAERDGRAVLRIDGKLYERQAVRVTDPAQLAELRAEFERLVTGWVAPAPLDPPPTEGPRDIWFFRMDPRPSA